jgi:branched-chain amino acid transport system ATP-binding protein/branched-chain amino acid transport system permease protein
VAADRIVRESGPLKPVLCLALGAVIVALLAFVPYVASGYHLALAISLLYFTVLATAWALFSGPTHYISLATVAFFGIGAYTVAVLGEVMPWPAVLAIAALIGIAVALVVGLSTLRLSGIYFVIFTFGLAELIRQLVSWYEININRSVGRYIFLSITTEQIYWQLLALTALVLLTGWLIARSRLGLALRVIGNDEVVARHSGIDTTRAKLAMFAISALFMTVTGAVMAPRWTYLDPAIAFSPLLSFEVVIMALLGGAGSLFGPLLGAVPLVLLFEVLTANFPNYFSILLGVVFVLIVYVLPRGVVGLFPARPRESRIAAAAVVPIETRAAPGAQLEVANLRKAFGGLVAVDDLSFNVQRGELIGLIGPNGSGKTTALNLISGALSPDAGAIQFKGRDLARTGAHRIARLGLARTFQLVRVLGSMTVMENVMPGFAFRSVPLTGAKAEAAAMALLARVGLAGKAALAATQLTHIDQKRLELARALALQPDLLLLDEWLAGLNPTELTEGIALIRSLRESGITIIMVEHVMDAIRSLCDRCVVMNVGRKIAEGPPASVLADREVVRAYLGGADA